MYANIHGAAPYDILKDINVRKAIEMGIDRSKYVSGVLNGLATTDQTWVPPAVLGSSASLVKGFQYDLNAAKAMLDTAGWRVGADGIREKAGRKLKLSLVSGFPSAEILRPTPTYVQAELKTLGIDVTIDERPDSASFQDLITKKQGDLFLEEGNQNDANAGFLPILLLYTGPGSSGGTYQGIEAPGATFDSILAPALTEPDLGKLQNIVARAMDEAITNQAVIIPMAGIFRTYGLKSTVQGFIPHPSFLNVNWIPVGLSQVVPYVLRRALLVIPTLLGISFLAFALANLAPGDPAEQVLRRTSDRQPTPREVAEKREELKLNRPLVDPVRGLGRAGLPGRPRHLLRHPAAGRHRAAGAHPLHPAAHGDGRPAGPGHRRAGGHRLRPAPQQAVRPGRPPAVARRGVDAQLLAGAQPHPAVRRAPVHGAGRRPGRVGTATSCPS